MVNAIREKLVSSIDMRHPDTVVLDAIEEQVVSELREAAARAICEVYVRRTFEMAPVAFPPAMVEPVDLATTTAGLSSTLLLSGAFHDALFLARVCPTAMMFVPCRDGVSHNEAEHVDTPRVLDGGRAMLAATLELAG